MTASELGAYAVPLMLDHVEWLREIKMKLLFHKGRI